MAAMGLFWGLVGLIALGARRRRAALHRGGVAILVSGRRWARIAGITVAALSAVANLGVLGICALTVHGWELDQR